MKIITIGINNLWDRQPNTITEQYAKIGSEALCAVEKEYGVCIPSSCTVHYPVPEGDVHSVLGKEVEPEMYEKVIKFVREYIAKRYRVRASLSFENREISFEFGHIRKVV